MEYYNWQDEIINFQGDVWIRGGRQTGKSLSVAKRIKKFAEDHPKSTTLLFAPGGRQEGYIREKILELFPKNYKFRRRVIKEWIPMQNGSDIFIYPVGNTGVYVEGLSSVDHLVVEEAGHVPEQVIDAVMPMLLEPKKRGLGWITALGNTRRCRLKGFFWQRFQEPNSETFKKFHVRAEDQPHADLEFLKNEKRRLGPDLYNVIYNGEFDERATKYFPKALIKSAIKIKGWKLENLDEESRYFLGVDPARYGRSKAGFVISEIPKSRNKIRLVHAESIRKSSLLDLKNKCLDLDKKFKKFKKLYPDDGGFGAGLVDILEEQFKKRLRPLNNRSKSKEGNRIGKEDYYSNLKKLLENGECEIVNNKELIDGLIDVNVNIDENGQVLIKGTDISEAAVRAAWAWKEKSLKLFVS